MIEDTFKHDQPVSAQRTLLVLHESLDCTIVMIYKLSLCSFNVQHVGVSLEGCRVSQ